MNEINHQTRNRDASGSHNESSTSVDTALHLSLERERSLLRTMIDLSPANIFAKDEQSRFLAANLMVAQGMVILDDVRTHMGTLLVPKGFEVTPVFLERMRNFGAGLLEEKVRVLVQAAKAASGAATQLSRNT